MEFAELGWRNWKASCCEDCRIVGQRFFAYFQSRNKKTVGVSGLVKDHSRISTSDFDDARVAPLQSPVLQGSEFDFTLSNRIMQTLNLRTCSFFLSLLAGSLQFAIAYSVYPRDLLLWDRLAGVGSMGRFYCPDQIAALIYFFRGYTTSRAR